MVYYNSSVLENFTKCKIMQFLCFYLLYICTIYMYTHAVKVKKKLTGRKARADITNLPVKPGYPF